MTRGFLVAYGIAASLFVTSAIRRCDCSTLKITPACVLRAELFGPEVEGSCAAEVDSVNMDPMTFYCGAPNGRHGARGRGPLTIMPRSHELSDITAHLLAECVAYSTMFGLEFIEEPPPCETTAVLRCAWHSSFHSIQFPCDTPNTLPMNVLDESWLLAICAADTANLMSTSHEKWGVRGSPNVYEPSLTWHLHGSSIDIDYLQISVPFNDTPPFDMRTYKIKRVPQDSSQEPWTSSH